MCNQPKPEKFLRNYPVSFKRELWQSIPTDVLFVTKEKLQIGAHKESIGYAIRGKGTSDVCIIVNATPP